MSEQGQTATERRDFVVIDGSGERYRVMGFAATFTLQSEETGNSVVVDSGTLRKLGIEWDGRQLQPVGGVDSAGCT